MVLQAKNIEDSRIFSRSTNLLQTYDITIWITYIFSDICHAFFGSLNHILTPKKIYASFRNSVKVITEFWPPMQRYLNKFITNSRMNEKIKELVQKSSKYVDHWKLHLALGRSYEGNFKKTSQTGSRMRHSPKYCLYHHIMTILQGFWSYATKI